jgi:phenylacetate-CoA ligase
LLCFSTSGTTGHPLRVPTLPLVAAAYQALHHRALRMLHVRPQAGRGDVGVVLAGYQQRCFTYVSVNPLRGECGLAKINLHPSEWRHPDDRGAYLDALKPELISGDPISLSALAELSMRHHPRALLSTSMALHAGLRAQLENHFCAPVLDIYSMNEAGPIAAYVPHVDAFVLLQPGLYVELLDDQGQAVPPGERGEITLTGGINPCLPLLRYRTGDHARWIDTPLGPALADLQGRPPVRFRHAQGQWVNNIELSQALRSLPLRRFALHQQANGHLHLRIDAFLGQGRDDVTRIEARLRELIAGCLGKLPLSFSPLAEQDKVRQYTSDLPGATDTHIHRS